MTEISLLVLLSIGHVLQPVLHDLAELDELAPSVKHLWLQVVISAIPVLHTSDRSGDQLEALLVSPCRHVVNLMGRETFVSHQVLQVVYIETMVQNFFDNWSNLIDFNDSVAIVRLLLPPFEGVSDLS